jgi:hypothetical protein
MAREAAGLKEFSLLARVVGDIMQRRCPDTAPVAATKPEGLARSAWWKSAGAGCRWARALIGSIGRALVLLAAPPSLA